MAPLCMQVVHTAYLCILKFTIDLVNFRKRVFDIYFILGFLSVILYRWW